MKRSEAIAAIQKVLYYRINGCTVCPDYIADEVLTKLENLRMLPPAAEFTIDVGTGPLITDANEWENE